jgi:hypothetical protein
MWHEVAVTGVMTICLISKLDTPGVSMPIRQAYLWVGPGLDVTSPRAEMGGATASWVSRNFGAHLRGL